jgi:oligoendopeptidase F
MAARRSSSRRKGSRPIKPLNPANKGKLRKAAGLGKKGRKLTVAELNKMKRSPNPTTRKRANFALNARKWSKKKRTR